LLIFVEDGEFNMRTQILTMMMVLATGIAIANNDQPASVAWLTDAIVARVPIATRSETPHIRIQNIINELISKGVSLDSQNRLGLTPLELAAGQWDVDVCKLLIQAGADVNAKGSRGWGRTPLQWALLGINGFGFKMKRYNYDVVANLVSKRMKTINLLLDNGADVNAQDNYGDSALSIAIDNDSQEVAELLIKGHANVNIQDNRGRTPLHIAVMHRVFTLAINLDLCKLLIQHGANVNIQDKAGNTPIHYAIVEYAKDIITLLQEAGATMTLAECIRYNLYKIIYG
jgi:ankyrin repeat protein